MNIVEYPDSEMMMIDLANRIAGDLTSALFNHDRVSLALPGGTTPGPVFDDLCDADLDWSRVDILLTDERWVPEESERSNTRLLRKRLLIDRAAEANYIPLYRNSDAPEGTLDEIAASITPILPISVLLLGMGADMHTASIFPGADRLDDALSTKAPPVMPMRATGAPEPRITLTAPVLVGAMTTHVVISGEEKRWALEKARHLPPTEAPIALVLKNAMVHWAP